MSNYALRMPIDGIDDGHGDDFAQHILSLWRKSEGSLTDDYIKVFPKLVLFDGVPVSGDSPDLLDCGHDALPLKLLGSTWAQNTDQLRTVMSADYRAMIGRGYFDAATQHLPIFDIVRADMKNEEGVRFDAFYHRLILPVWELGGSRFLLSYSFQLGMQTLVRGPSSGYESPADRRREKLGYANLFQAGALSTQRRQYRTY